MPQKVLNHTIKELNSELEKKVQEKTSELQKAIADLQLQMKAADLAREELSKVLLFTESLLANAGVMIISTDENGIITLFNRKAEKTLGYTSAEIVGKVNPCIFHFEGAVANDIHTASEQQRKEISPGFKIFIENARQRGSFESECIYVDKDGKTFPVLLTVTPLKNDANKITGFLGVASDISARKKAEDVLLSSLKKEKELNEMKTRFVSMASHEFRTPLSTIASSAYLIGNYNDKQDQPKREKHIARITSSVNILTETLNDFLSAGKIEDGKIKVAYCGFDVCDEINNIINRMEYLLKPGQKVVYNHAGQTSISLDPALLKTIVENVLANAIKFSGENKMIEISSSVTANTFTLIIKDNGIGIPEVDKKHLFERFFRGSNVINIQGTGLGLSIVKKYTELMNGNISFKSELGKGTCIKVEFRSTTDHHVKD